MYKATYRKSLTTLFPRFLKAMAKYHDADIRRYFKDVFGYEGNLEESTDNMIKLFEALGIDMYFDGEISAQEIKNIDISTMLSADEVVEIIGGCLR